MSGRRDAAPPILGSRGPGIRGSRRDEGPPVRWHSTVLRLAALYNLAFGAGVVLFPRWWFAVADLPPPLYPSIWQCVGMIVGVYGVGYWLAARAPYVHWPIVLVGLLGKVFGPIGFVLAAARGELPWRVGWLLVGNDLVWLWAFAAILLGARSAARANVHADGRAAAGGPAPSPR